MYPVRLLTVWLLLLLAHASWTPASALAAPSAADREQARKAILQRACAGQISWRTFLQRFSQINPSVFLNDRLAQGSPQKFRILALDRQSQTAYLRDRKALRSVEHDGRIETEHLLGIPIGPRQPIWLSNVGARDASRLGQMTRRVLEMPRELHQLDRQTEVYFNLPGDMSQPLLHAHSKWRSGDKPIVRSWPQLLRTSYQPIPAALPDGFQLYEARPQARGRAARWPVVAIADRARGRPDALGAATDELLGRMILSVSRVALGLSPSLITRGKITIDRAETRIVVRVEDRDASGLASQVSHPAFPSALTATTAPIR